MTGHGSIPANITFCDGGDARHAGRLRLEPVGQQDELATAVEAWERIGARYERACTLLLIPDREEEGRKELAALHAS